MKQHNEDANFTGAVQISGVAIDEFIRDTIATALVQGQGASVAVDDSGDTITIGAPFDLAAQMAFGG